MEQREGTILNTTEKDMTDSISGTTVKYHNPASVTIDVNDKVIYIRIVTGNGQTINIIKEKKV
ncbi:MAG: hypothetical protein ACOZCO_04950 [Bacteroidota bacterium]